MKSLNHKWLVQNYRYDPETGLFFRFGSARVLGSLNSDGYVKIKMRGQTVLAHRLAWFYVHGVWPEFVIDHRNEVRHDNRIRNLRDIRQRKNVVRRGAVADAKGPPKTSGMSYSDLVRQLVAA